MTVCCCSIFQNPAADHWIQPIIQGFFDIKTCHMPASETYNSSKFHSDVFEFRISVLSRRSRHRAGTRYKRRGVDSKGDCANYVETEQVGDIYTVSSPHCVCESVAKHSIV